jgi:hypothetical protein
LPLTERCAGLPYTRIPPEPPFCAISDCFTLAVMPPEPVDDRSASSLDSLARSSWPEPFARAVSARTLPPTCSWPEPFTLAIA